MMRAWSVLAAWAIVSALVIGGAGAVEGTGLWLSKDGHIVTITGTTNLAPGNVLQVTVISAGFTPTVKTAPADFSGAGGTAVVQKGSPLNRFTFEADVSAFQDGEYLVTVESVETGLRETAMFVLPWTPVPARTTLPEVPASTVITPPSTPIPATVPGASESPTEAPLLGIISVCALVLTICHLRSRR